MRVLLQAHGVAEGFPADVAGEGPGPAVRAAGVHLQPVGGGEHLRGRAEREARGLQGGGGAQLGRRWTSRGGRKPAITGLLTLLARVCVLGRSLSLSASGFPGYRMAREGRSGRPLLALSGG